MQDWFQMKWSLLSDQRLTRPERDRRPSREFRVPKSWVYMRNKITSFFGRLKSRDYISVSLLYLRMQLLTFLRKVKQRFDLIK